ncbi:Dehydrogenase [Lentimonas sp. CC19]|nr:Dehydrogenase [Lentimonas sp. CC10]CAA6694698.1 Dehydrogenase [Lentimonas sp. CC19]CAA7071443.1 Dehydrogenase [Lentimonas sp. CC11]
MQIGIIGCGKISDAYFNGGKHAENLNIKACADLNFEAAQAKATEHGCEAVSIEDLLNDSEIELVVNLTIPRAHVEVGTQILEAGKHAYAEKPLAERLDEADKLMAVAAKTGKRIGSAPDTFLFGHSQTARKLIDDNWIGTPTSGTAFMRCAGHESWHPSPNFYYDLGGGPLLDMGPYYITSLVNLLGPVKSVIARTNRARDERIATAEGIKGQRIPVKIDTHTTGVLEFANGALITMIMSFDTHRSAPENLTINGTHGSLNIGDPNNYNTPPKVFCPGQADWMDAPTTHPDNARMIGVVDMVDAIQNDRPHRASGELAYHVLEVMEAFDVSSKSGSAVEMKTAPERPAALPLGLREWTADSSL